MLFGDDDHGVSFAILETVDIAVTSNLQKPDVYAPVRFPVFRPYNRIFRNKKTLTWNL